VVFYEKNKELIIIEDAKKWDFIMSKKRSNEDIYKELRQSFSYRKTLMTL